ncbi:MAG: hypothetical protein KFH98_04500 [Gemmatimonadetes bacterium]|nr:hypothetical protein [Gemmatimonadota bacterium]
MRTILVVFVLAALAGACADGDPEAAATPADTLTRAQRDSIIGASSLPGARSVQRAIDTRDSANARGAAMDSLLR